MVSRFASVTEEQISLINEAAWFGLRTFNGKLSTSPNSKFEANIM